MNKIIALIKPSAPLFYFVNQIHREHAIHAVVIEDKYFGKISVANKIRNQLALGAGTLKSPQAAVRIKNQNIAGLVRRYFGEEGFNLDKSLQVIYCRNINEPAVEEFLAEEKPDLLLDHGTSIVKAHILEKAPLALNLHWGLSPYYRGTHCTEWALINWDPYNIGVTIHRLARAIDGGDVLVQARVHVESDDSVSSINMKLTCAGTKVLIDALYDWQQGKIFEFHAQDFSLGYLTLNRQWRSPLKKHIKFIERNNVIATMLKHPARRERLPLIETVAKLREGVD